MLRKCLRRRRVVVTLFMGYICMCLYLFFVKQASPQVQDIIRLTGRDGEQNSSKNWHFEEHGHQHFHEEQTRLKKEKERRIERELEEARAKLQSIALFKPWILGHKKLENCTVDVFNSKLVELHDVILDRKLAFASAKGGEEIKDVMNRNDNDEMYVVKPGFFAVPYRNRNKTKCLVSLNGDAAHLKQWSKAVKGFHPPAPDPTGYSDDFTVLVTRYEYANVYWTIMDLYDTFLTVTFLRQTMNNTHLLIVDGHPATPLDRLWYGIFKNVSRPHQLPALSAHRTMAWTFAREFSPMLIKSADLPLIHEFRDAVLQSFKVPLNHRPKCSNLNVLFIWRRNYVAHPRNPKGIIARKISNEDELVSAVRAQFPGYNVTGVQLDLLPMSQQLQLLANTDILVGMHGAAFGFSVLLPPTSAVIELFPYGFNSNWHMEALAKKSGHFYYLWKNKDKTLEDPVKLYTKVPPPSVTVLVTKASKQLCPGRRTGESDTDQKSKAAQTLKPQKGKAESKSQ